MLVSYEVETYNARMAAELIPESHDRFHWPQFGLRSLFLAIALLGVLFALMTAIGATASAALLLILAMVGLHVAGNRLGTLLRDGADDRCSENSCAESLVDAPPIPVPQNQPLPRLCQHTRLSWLNRILIALGIVAGATCGYEVLLNWTTAALPGLVVGSVSSGVLGGSFGFLLASFLEIALCAWWQASSDINSNDRAVVANRPA